MKVRLIGFWFFWFFLSGWKTYCTGCLTVFPCAEYCRQSYGWNGFIVANLTIVPSRGDCPCLKKVFVILVYDLCFSNMPSHAWLFTFSRKGKSGMMLLYCCTCLRCQSTPLQDPVEWSSSFSSSTTKSHSHPPLIVISLLCRGDKGVRFWTSLSALIFTGYTTFWCEYLSVFLQIPSGRHCLNMCTILPLWSSIVGWALECSLGCFLVYKPDWPQASSNRAQPQLDRHSIQHLQRFIQLTHDSVRHCIVYL